jgi:hypothetical protein
MVVSERMELLSASEPPEGEVSSLILLIKIALVKIRPLDNSYFSKAARQKPKFLEGIKNPEPEDHLSYSQVKSFALPIFEVKLL